MRGIVQFVSDHILIMVLAFATIATFFWLLAFRKRLRMTWGAVLGLSILHVVYGVFCVRVFARFEGASVGAMSIFGAVFFMPVGYYLGAKLFKRPIADVFDVFTVPMVFTLLCSRVNCLVSGCCIGLPISGTELRWPTREAEMVFYLVFLSLIAPKVKKGKTKGEVYPLYMACYGVFRAVIECFRVSSATRHIFHLSHVWAIISCALGFSIYIELKERSNNNPKRT